VGHEHEHEHVRRQGEEGEQLFDPLRAPEYVKEEVEELERKWSFEVSFSCF
jgi:hypothetical protein